jgi:hypothetical protein
MFDRNTYVDDCLDIPSERNLYIWVLVGVLVYDSVGKRVHHGWRLFETWSFWSGSMGAMGMHH